MPYLVEIPQDQPVKKVWLICCVCTKLFEGPDLKGCSCFSFCDMECWNNAPHNLLDTISSLQ